MPTSNRTIPLDRADFWSPSAEQGQRILRLYHLYRLSVGLALVLLVTSNMHRELLDMADPQLFRYGSWAYLATNVVLGVLLQQANRPLQLFGLALFDVSLLSALFYAAGGIPSGLAPLLVISVAIANSILRGRLGLLIAALASSGLIYLTFYLSLSRPAATAQYVQAGALGTLCFAAALIIQALGRRLQQSETLARRHAADVADLQALNALILQRMRTGILVLDPQLRVLLANPSSQTLLGQSQLVTQRLDAHCPALLERLQQWQENPALRPQSLQAFAEGPVLQPSFVPLRRKGERDILVFLEDVSQIAQQAQQLKLASLGRLTAGIAHEIRNPLGAISHAAQLLQEAEDLSAPDRRLTQIILDHSRRMNLVVENVLQLSRRRQAEPQLLDLRYWLHRFAGELRETQRGDSAVNLQCVSGSIQTRMDPQQLTQILTNLVQNGLRHSARKHDKGQVWLQLFRDGATQLPVLEISDDGDGIPADQLGNLFEPFFSTENKGTGLGLYISRELCESNRARLDHVPREGGACFRITFAHPKTAS
ncbi:two-component system, NtrC family, sensor histidine kinase PilS [Pseudomonas linyingensis]|uniref:histidine kinase n=1 Tax=Pseudomonas linyingensis TaxID=915471 RepID=A0A1H6RNU4_9PSED|nr:two-component system, NtrC family, sensor histidine kinase PilS [Pseudomonas linyingensis]